MPQPPETKYWRTLSRYHISRSAWGATSSESRVCPKQTCDLVWLRLLLCFVLCLISFKVASWFCGFVASSGSQVGQNQGTNSPKKTAELIWRIKPSIFDGLIILTHTHIQTWGGMVLIQYWYPAGMPPKNIHHVNHALFFFTSIRFCLYGGFHKWDTFNSWMVYFMENPNLKWRI